MRKKGLDLSDDQKLTIERSDIFEDIFRRLLFKEPKKAARYYVALVENIPGTGIMSLAEKSSMHYTVLIQGRKELLERGLIAKILPINEVSEESRKKGELYLPTNPIIAWQEAQIGEADERGTEARENEIIKLKGIFKNNWGFNEMGLVNGDISLIYGGRWLFYTLIDNLEMNPHLDMMIGGLGSFKAPYIKFYERMFNENEDLKLRILYGFPTSQMSKKQKEIICDRLKDLEALKKRDHNLSYYASAVPHATSRRALFSNSKEEPYMAIDARKLLPIDRKDPSYIGTIYFQTDAISWMKQNFEETWDKTTQST